MILMKTKSLQTQKKVSSAQTNRQSQHVTNSNWADQPGWSYTGGKILVPNWL